MGFRKKQVSNMYIDVIKDIYDALVLGWEQLEGKHKGSLSP